MNFGAALSASAIFSPSVTGKRSAVVWAPAVSAAKRQSTISFISHLRKNVLAIQLSSRRAVLCSGILEELYQRLVEQSGYSRWLCLREFAEECRRWVHVDPCLLAVPLGHADTHGSAQAGGTGVLEQTTRNDSIPDKVEFRLDVNSRQAHRGALLEVPEDCHWLGSRVDVSFDTRAVAVRHIFHQFGSVEALHAALDRLSNLEEGLARPYCEEDRIVFGSRRLWGDCHCFVCGFHLWVLLLLS